MPTTSQAIKALTPNPTIYPFEQSPEEVEEIIKEKIEQIERENK